MTKDSKAAPATFLLTDDVLFHAASKKLINSDEDIVKYAVSRLNRNYNYFPTTEQIAVVTKTFKSQRKEGALNMALGIKVENGIPNHSETIKRLTMAAIADFLELRDAKNIPNTLPKKTV